LKGEKRMEPTAVRELLSYTQCCGWGGGAWGGRRGRRGPGPG
jgi:hypothetical protein